MHHQTGLSSINNISIRNRSTDSSVVKIILLKEKTDLKKKRVHRWNSTLDLDSSRVLEPQKRYLNIRTVGAALISVSRNGIWKKVFRACLYQLINETETNNKFRSKEIFLMEASLVSQW